ncbi:MAG: GSCFA domain-containing protein [Bacteroides sp.]|nr:GSCFA domain-containing protein [Bacteroides sp.]MCM1095808.1 GSCFA domain-containing protein [Terasakiella sp.]
MICFRTEIGRLRGGFEIRRDDRIVLLGSCFADNIGERLATDGFAAVHNPLGPLYNPASILRVLARGGRPYGEADMVCHAGTWHCLDAACRYQGADPGAVADAVNADYLPLARAVDEADVVIVTFGTSHVFEHGGTVAGNCHKLPAAEFERRMLSPAEIADAWAAVPALSGKRLIFTISPVRYTSDGLADGSLAKAILRVAVDDICRRTGADYFPACEIVCDDLRDYRFYADDLRHPSAMAVEYIYEKFAEAYFSPATCEAARAARRAWLRSQHRPIIAT